MRKISILFSLLVCVSLNAQNYMSKPIEYRKTRSYVPNYGNHSANKSSNKISCNELMAYVISKDKYPKTLNCYNSSLLAKVKRYEVEGVGVVVAYIKENEYDYKGRPYIFCGISSYTWINFTSDGTYNSWGKAFHKYIMDNKCNCY